MIATVSAPGLYNIQLTVDDGIGTNQAASTIIVNEAPTVSAGLSEKTLANLRSNLLAAVCAHGGARSFNGTHQHLTPPWQALMKLIDERLPEATVLSVGHRPELEKYHQRKLVLEPRKEGAKLARDIPLAPRRRKRRWRWSGRRKRAGTGTKAAA